MKLMLWGLKVIFPVLLLSVGGARLAGAQQRNVSVAALFTFPDGRDCPSPCLFGVRPGITDHMTALQLLHQHPALSGAQFNEVTRANNFGNAGGVISTEEMRIGLSTGEDGTISYLIVDVQLPPKNRPEVWSIARFDRATFADLVALLGTPEQVQLTRRRLSAQAYYLDRGISITLRSQHLRRLSWKDAAVVLYVQAKPLPKTDNMQVWRGFGRTQRYERTTH